MRAFLFAAAATLAIAPAASAQGLNADGLRPLYGVEAVETSPLQRLAPEARGWIAEERARQKSKPTDLVELAVDIDSNIGEAIRKLAKRERVGNGDLILVVMYAIVGGAREEVDAELEQLRTAGASEIEIQTLATRRAELDAKLAEVVAEQTTVSRSLVPQLAWSE
jgi:hypothetical protein